MKLDRNTNRDSQPHILNAASNLLGICFVLITGLKISGASESTWLDEIAIVTAMLFALSCLLSYASIRTERSTQRLEAIADGFFLVALILLSTAVFTFGLTALVKT